MRATTWRAWQSTTWFRNGTGVEAGDYVLVYTFVAGKQTDLVVTFDMTSNSVGSVAGTVQLEGSRSRARSISSSFPREGQMDAVLRAVAVYGVSGKRTLAQTTTFDFVPWLILGEATQQGLIGDDFSL